MGPLLDADQTIDDKKWTYHTYIRQDNVLHVWRVKTLKWYRRGDRLQGKTVVRYVNLVFLDTTYKSSLNLLIYIAIDSS